MNKNNGFDIDNKIKAIFNEEIEVPDIVNVKSKEAYEGKYIMINYKKIK